ncbi:MAG TPA: hypothetical protein VF618_19090 [Thermoanaerobaculia bacterium]
MTHSGAALDHSPIGVRRRKAATIQRVLRLGTDKTLIRVFALLCGTTPQAYRGQMKKRQWTGPPSGPIVISLLHQDGTADKMLLPRGAGAPDTSLSSMRHRGTAISSSSPGDAVRGSASLISNSHSKD